MLVNTNDWLPELIMNYALGDAPTSRSIILEFGHPA
jgi:hypothetical protein